MIVLWITLLILHRGYSLAPVITAQLGQPVTFTCPLSDVEINTKQIYWCKQSAGDAMKLIVSVFRTTEHKYAPEFSESRFKTNIDERFMNLTIVRTSQEDEGLYHCAVMDWSDIKWSGTYLFVKGTSQRTSNYTVVQQPTASGPVRPGDSMTLQCSVFSGSEDQTCPGDHSVYWFRAGSDESHPDIIYTDGYKPGKCEGRTDARSAPKSCVYRFTKDVSSSDAGTYYCAVASCGHMLIGNGTKVDIQESMWSVSGVTLVLCALLVLCLIVIVVLICARKKSKCEYCNAVALHKNNGTLKSQQRDEDTRVYSAVMFAVMKTNRQDTMSAEREKIYAAVKAFGLDQ